MRDGAPDPERWVANDCIVIHADVRGAGASPGMLDPFSPRETEDYATLITWAAHQPWSSGKVGLLGTSFQAINRYRVAALKPEGLVAILPWEGAYDQYREIAYYGGILNVAWEYWWTHQVVPNQNGDAETPLIDSINGGKDTGTPLSAEALKQNRVDPVQAFARHPFDDAYYRERTPDGSRITVPMLAVGQQAEMAAHPDRRSPDALLFRRGDRAAEALLRSFPQGREQRMGEGAAGRGADPTPDWHDVAIHSRSLVCSESHSRTSALALPARISRRRKRGRAATASAHSGSQPHPWRRQLRRHNLCGERDIHRGRKG